MKGQKKEYLKVKGRPCEVNSRIKPFLIKTAIFVDESFPETIHRATYYQHLGIIALNFEKINDEFFNEFRIREERKIGRYTSERDLGKALGEEIDILEFMSDAYAQFITPGKWDEYHRHRIEFLDFCRNLSQEESQQVNNYSTWKHFFLGQNLSRNKK
ncbi:MAG: hypothetical protein Q8N88_00925 [Nanoarchaeota archaeon]|nr:hypothetical protein [Nanoarchaeota archaeon]